MFLYIHGTGPIQIDDAATAIDVDSADFNGGTLTVDFSVGATANDRLGIAPEGDGTGQIDVDNSLNNIEYEGNVIGTIAGGSNGTTPLVITFNSGFATPQAAQALIRRVSYENTSSIIVVQNRTARFVISDGDGGTSTVQNACDPGQST